MDLLVAWRSLILPYMKNPNSVSFTVPIQLLFSGALALFLLSGCAAGDSSSAGDTGNKTAEDSVDSPDGVGPGAEDAGDTTNNADTGEEEDKVTGLSCFPAFAPDKLNWSYDDIDPVIGSHCKGTNHQDIVGIEKVVFLGDSITAGTFPTSQAGFYRNVLLEKLEEDFGPLEVADCSGGGAVASDLISGQKQLAACFPGVEEKKTLVVMTLGGNDVQSFAFSKTPAAQAIPMIDQFMGNFRQGIQWFDDASIFPNGVYVIFANVYEFTDGTANLSACSALSLFGSGGVWADGIEVFGYLANQYLQLSVDTGRDMIFLAENFCGHGLNASDASSPCAEMTDGEVWFGGDCIHPNAKGHAAIADLFYNVVIE